MRKRATIRALTKRTNTLYTWIGRGLIAVIMILIIFNAIVLVFGVLDFITE